MNIPSDKSDNQQLLDYLKKLEARISRIEARLNLKPVKTPEKAVPSDSQPTVEVTNSADALELRIGEFWFAKVGIVVLAVGIAFLLTLPYQNLPPILPSVIGYVLVAGIWLLAYYWRTTYSYISRYLVGGGLVLLYFTSLRLYFFSSRPAVTGKWLEIILLAAVAIISLFISVRRKSIYLAGISLIMGYATAIVSDQSIFIFIVLTVMAGLTVYFKLKYQWYNLYIFGIILTYLVHFIWFLNNPIMENQIRMVDSPLANIYFVLLYAAIFATGNLLRDKKLPENNFLIISTFLNCLGSYGLFLLLTITKFQGQLFASHLIASILFLVLSVIFWTREQSKYSTFFYAILGYTALSAAIIAQSKLPNFFIWLSWQSILVVSTAIWFRSKIIIVANFLIYVILFFAYLALAGKVSAISLSFGLVALISARILNWKKDRLELKTELMRNAYLAAAFFVFPYALYHSVSGEYVSLSWVGLTLFYYIISRLLHNTKYRWMAILTLLLTVLRVFIVDTTNINPVYRVASFLVVGIVLIIVSVVYTRKRTRAGSKES